MAVAGLKEIIDASQVRPPIDGILARMVPVYLKLKIYIHFAWVIEYPLVHVFVSDVNK